MARARITTWGMVVFFSCCLLAIGALLIGASRSVASDVAQAQRLAAHGVPVPLVKADLVTEVVRALRASGDDSCTLKSVTLHYTFRGALVTGVPRLTNVDDYATCAMVLEVAQRVYHSGTLLLIDPAVPISVAVASLNPREAARTSDSGSGTAAGAALAGLGALLGLPYVLHRRQVSRRSRAAALGGTRPAGWGASRR